MSVSATEQLEAAGLATAAGSRRVSRFGRWRVPEIFALVWLIALVLGTLFLPTILGLHAQDLNVGAQLSGPSAEHLLGTDNLGHDLLARVLAGARISLSIGFGSVLIAALIGIPIGMFAAYLGGAFSAIATFFVDVVLAFPGLILALTLAAFLGASYSSVLIAITVPMIPVFARLAKIQTASVLQREYVEASRVIGTSMLSILGRDVLPNIAQGMLAFALASVGTAIIIEASLAFIGLGVPPPQPTWGGMVADGQNYLQTGPLMIIVPAAFLVLTIVSLNLLSDRFLSEQGADRG